MVASNFADILSGFERDLTRLPLDAARLGSVLAELVQTLGFDSGTVHVMDATGSLALAAEHGIPAAVVARIRQVPVGKGLAGSAAQKREPVQVCNLQSAASAAEPAAKQSGMQGAIALPLLADQQLVGVIGLGLKDAHTFGAVEIAQLGQLAAALASRIDTAPSAGPAPGAEQGATTRL
jgi:putative methionine-R-sulfoxide reductase with GAF domain